MVVPAPAKINWVLDLLEKRSDGYHELETVASAVGLADELTIAGNGAAGLALTCSDAALPTDERNLVHRAATLLARRAGIEPNASIHLTKRIPAEAGLGGGSSDAAAVLRALNARWALNWSLARLAPLAAAVGSDVPLMLFGGTAIARGRGEFVEPIDFRWPGWVAIAMPGIPVPTAAVYANVKAEDLRIASGAAPVFADSQAASRWTAADLLERCRNDLEKPAFRQFGALAELQGELQRACGRPWRLCGSGSAFFTAWDEGEEAADCVRKVRERLGIRAEAARVEGTEAANRKDSQGGSDGHQ